jgi:hypothetical protein
VCRTRRRVVLERAGQTAKASDVWQRLGRLFEVIATRGESSFLPQCARCAERLLEFAPSWFSVATQLRDLAGGVPAIANAFREHALSMDDSGSPNCAPFRRRLKAPVDVAEGADPKRVGPSLESAKQTENTPDTPISKAKLKAKREVIRKTYRELDQPATVVELCDQHLKSNHSTVSCGPATVIASLIWVVMPMRRRRSKQPGDS